MLEGDRLCLNPYLETIADVAEDQEPIVSVHPLFIQRPFPHRRKPWTKLESADSSSLAKAKSTDRLCLNPFQNRKEALFTRNLVVSVLTAVIVFQ
jgi:hypothetical protein